MATFEPSDDIVPVATAINPLQAHIYQQALAAAGIKSRVVGDFLDAGLGDIPGINSEVWVHRNDLARAEAVLRQGQEHAEPDSSEEAES